MKFGGIDNAIPKETWESLLFTANVDFVSALNLWYNGIAPGSTYIWMLPHSLEKYLKSYLVKHGKCNVEDLRKLGKSGHELKVIWDEFKQHCPCKTAKTKLNQAFDDIIDDLDSITPRLRYSGCIGFSSDQLLYFYIVLSSYIRYLLVGKVAYRKSLYGLDEGCFLPMNNVPMMEGYGKTIIRKMLHISLEHAGMFTNLGFVNNVDFKELSISNTAILEKHPDCPICGNGNVDQVSLIKYYRGLAPIVIK